MGTKRRMVDSGKNLKEESRRVIYKVSDGVILTVFYMSFLVPLVDTPF